MKAKICQGVGEANVFLQNKEVIIRKTHVVNDRDVGVLITSHYDTLEV